MDLEQTAIERLRFAAEMSLRVYKQPLVITYSGGKDSDVLLHLAGKAGIQYEVLHSLTTADAPETVWHVRDTFRRLELTGVKCDIDTHRTPDGGNVTMWNLIPRKLMPPTRRMRYSVSGIEKGDVYCYEIKSSVEDFHSKNGHNLIGDFNYYVMPYDVYEKIHMVLPYNVGVMCPQPPEDSFFGRTTLVTKKNAKRKDRTRPLTEMLLMMWRSSRREIVKARKAVNRNDES